MHLRVKEDISAHVPLGRGKLLILSRNERFSQANITVPTICKAI